MRGPHPHRADEAAAQKIEHPPRTFDDFCADYTITQAEREALVWHLAAFRARKTIETLLPTTDPRIGGCRTDVRKNRPLSEIFPPVAVKDEALMTPTERIEMERARQNFGKGRAP